MADRGLEWIYDDLLEELRNGHSRDGSGTRLGAEDRHCVLLVHGTWAPNSPWTQPGSPLLVALRRAFGARTPVCRFVWSGTNSQLARVTAAEELTAVLVGPELCGYASVHIIGHSHGGTIAAKACEQAGGRVASLVTLSSPFFSAVRLQEPQIRSFYENATAFVLFGIALALLVTHWATAVAFTYIPPYDSDWHAVAVGAVPMLILWGIYLAASAFGRWAGRVHGHLAKTIPAKYAGFGIAYVPIKPIYYGLDEAYRLIAAALGLQSRIGAAEVSAGRLLEHLDRLRFSLTGGCVLAFVIKMWCWPDARTPFLDTLGAILMLAGLLFLLGRPIVLYLADLNIFTPLWTSYFSNGPDSAFDSFFVRVEVLQRPVGSEVAEPLIPPLAKWWRIGARSQLMHSEICFDPRAIKAVVDWLRIRLPGKGVAGGLEAS